MIKCSQCGADNPEDSNFCRSCGENLKSTHKFCPECGQENSKNAKFCVGCGLSFEKHDVDSDNQNNLIRSNSEPNPDKSQDSSDEMVMLDLTPAESLIILDQETPTKDLLKSTFIDLIFKNVFKIEVKKGVKKGFFGTKIFKDTYLYEGKNFNMPLKPHEEVFRKYLPDKVDSKRFKKLIQSVARSSGDYTKKQLLEPLAAEGYFNVEKKFFGKKYSLSDKGIETEQLILKLKDEGRDLDVWVDKDPERAKAYISMGGSNIFLTDDYYFNWFKNNSKKISKLFTGAAVIGTAYAFSKIRWYRAFSYHGIDFDFDEFSSSDNDFNSFGLDFTDIFSDSSAFDSFGAIDFDDFDAGFDSGGFDGGFDGGDGGGGE